MNWRRCERNRYRPNLNYSSDICQEELKITTNICHDWRFLGWDSNRTALEYKLEVLPFFWISYKELYFVTTALSRCFYNPIWRTWSLFLCTCSQGDFTYHLRANLLVWANSWTQFRLCCRPERTAPNISVLKLLCPIRYISHPLWSCLRSAVDLVEIN